MTTILAGLLLSAAFGAAAPSTKNKAAERPRQTVVDDSFEVLAPGDWKIERKPAGAVLTGPSAEGLPTRVIVRWVRPDHALYATPEAYMARFTKASLIPMKGWKNGAVETLSAGGRKALRLQRETTEFVPPQGMAPKEVAMREEHVAVTAAKGFYLLVYTAPRSIDAAQRAEFRRLVETGFKPKL